MTKSRLFKNPRLLEETTKIGKINPTQKLDVTRIEKKVAQWTKGESNKIVAYVGAFGSGKSVVLEKIMRKDQKNEVPKYLWAKFDIWRYADRQQLWDGFVVETIARIRCQGRDDAPDFKEVVDKIEGISSNRLMRFIKSHFTPILIILPAAWFGISFALWHWLAVPQNTYEAFLRALLIYGPGVLFFILAFMGIKSILPDPERPLRRVFELEDELKSELKQLKKPLVVLIEDVDRAGNEGMAFLETLRNFLKDEKSFSFPVIVLAPQDRTYFDIIDNRGVEGFERSLKIYDLVAYYRAPTLENSYIRDLLKKLGFRDDVAGPFETTILDLIGQADYREQMTMRLLKFILREVDEFVDANPDANPSIAFTLIMSRYIKVAESTYSPSKLKVAGKILHNSSRRNEDIRLTDSARSSVAPFVEALARLTPSNPKGLRKIKLEFNVQSSEISATPVTNATGAIIGCHIVLDDKYRLLFRS